MISTYLLTVSSFQIARLAYYVISVILGRPSEGDWCGSSVEGHWCGSSGHGISDPD